MKKLYATDLGPQCPRCKYTLWVYKQVEHPDYYGYGWQAECVMCKYTTKFNAPVSSALTVQNLRQYHTIAETGR